MIVCVDNNITTVIIYNYSTTESSHVCASGQKHLVEKWSATRPARPSAWPTVRHTHTRAICPVIGGDPDLCVTDGRVPPVTSVVSLAAQTNTRVPLAAVFVSRKLYKIHGGVQTKLYIGRYNENFIFISHLTY